jgi:hypothetical protein
MKLMVKTGTAGRVEHGIRPPMQQVVSLPLTIDGRENGMTVYVATSPWPALFGSGAIDKAVIDDATLTEIAKKIGNAINAVWMTGEDIDISAIDANTLTDVRFAELAGLYLSRDEVLDALVKAAPAALPLVAALVSRLRRLASVNEEIAGKLDNPDG